MGDPKTGGVGVVREMIGEAEIFTPEPLRLGQHDPEPGEKHGEVWPGNWEPNGLGLPDDCPVIPLGVSGNTYYFLDTLVQLRRVEAKEFSKNMIASLFMGRGNYLLWAWPRMKAKGPADTFCADKVRDTLMAACAIKGPWTPEERVRGRGAWRGKRANLILHLGDRLIVDGRERPVGELGGFVYPAARVAWDPWPHAIEGDDGAHPARELLEMLRRWQWDRPDVDPVLLMGWIVSAFLGGALEWRSFVCLTGGHGTGKSTLQSIIKAIFGEGLISTTNTTAAGIYQALKQDCLPVAIDEFESGDDNRRAMAVVELARQSSSGGKLMRGGESGTGSEFKAQSSFIFSAINVPPMQPQDLSRVGLLKLQRIAKDAKPIVIDQEAFAQIGRKILRLALDNWRSFEPTLSAIKDELREGGHDQRGQATFGTLLACASLVVGDLYEELDVPLGEDLRPWRDLLAVKNITEMSGLEDNWRACLGHLLGAPVRAWRGGGRVTVGACLEAFFTSKELDGGQTTMTYGDARSQLAQAGLGLQRPDAMGGPHWLCVPHNNPLLWELFEGSKWAGVAGAGVWSHALQQGPRGTLWEFGSVRINGNKSKCLRISLDALFGRNGLMADDEPIVPTQDQD